MPGDRERKPAQRRQLASWPSICSLWARWIFGQLDSGSAGGSLAGAVSPDTQLVVTPLTEDPEIARGWLEDLAARGFEGIVAKQTCLPYRSGKRAKVKVKRWRSADLVVGGYLGPPGDPWSSLAPTWT
jgi:hypothetical protein